MMLYLGYFLGHSKSTVLNYVCFSFSFFSFSLCIQGYKQQKAFIIAQGPMDTTTRDFWKMVYDRKCGAIVMLSRLNEVSCCVIHIYSDTQQHTDTHRDTQAHTGTHSDTQAHTGTHRHTQAHTGTHRHTQAHTGTHSDTQAHIGTHRHTQGHTGTHRHTGTHSNTQ